MCRCSKCGSYLQEEPRIACFCGETKRIFSDLVEESICFKDSGNLSISRFLSERNILNTSFYNKITNLNLNFFLKNKEIKECFSHPIIYFHDCFIEGSQNANVGLGKLIDLPNIHNENLEIFNIFIMNVFHKTLQGKNKPSHENNINHKLYPYYWHYHCGPYKNTTKNNTIENLFEENLNGDTSSPVIHYIKNEDKIIVVGFATEHTSTFQNKSKIEEFICF